MPKREVTPNPVAGEPRAALFVTDVAHLAKGEVLAAPGTVGPLLQYGVLTRVEVADGGVRVWLAEEHSWTDHGPRIRDAIRLAVDLDGWEVC
ncbi:hypothetical protein [Tessaracoccus sp. OH4464_COT-324]|uniref:hypothetical protein n=1 Tax=Tessaracoccus sp. OH4464_COT-324 TaxID=2491059 RepID=UPI000F62E8D9|nr:hypothetical protein [Tessaracoccus sp. OH4464_COT-324]RRD46028.1 hypothetical protein EII42_08735 [Tessaracoccus sp. OH4464_COT-324]